MDSNPGLWPCPRKTLSEARKSIVILDMDGTILNLNLNSDKVRHDVRKFFKSKGIENNFVPLLQNIEKELESKPELRDEVWEIIDQEEFEAARNATLVPGAMEFLEALDMPVALFTNNSIPAVHAALDHVGIPIDTFYAIEARESAASIKPSAEPLKRLISKAPPTGTCFFIGDHLYDMKSAIAHGDVVPMGLYKSREHRTELEKAGAWFSIASLNEALSFLNQPKIPLSLSLVVLAFNEEDTIREAIEDARRFCRTYVSDYELIVVDDGSADKHLNTFKMPIKAMSYSCATREIWEWAYRCMTVI